MQLGRLSKEERCVKAFVVTLGWPNIAAPSVLYVRETMCQVDCGGVPLGSSCFSDPSHFQLKVTFHLKHKQFPLEALLDTGGLKTSPVSHLFVSLGRRTPSRTLPHSVPDPTSSHVHRGPLGVDPVSRGLCCVLSSHPGLTFLIGDPNSPLVSGRSSAV